MRIYDGPVSPAMTAWALEVLHDTRLGLGATEARTIDGVPLLARVETHTNGTAQRPEPHEHRGVTLYTLEPSEAPPDTQPTGAPVARARGVDVSSYQKGADFSRIAAAGYSFAFIKVHEGLYLDDSAAVEHHENAGNAGLLRGAYTFFRVGVDAREQVRRFWGKAQNIGPWELPYVLDVEAQGRVALGGASPATFTGDVCNALDELAQLAGARPLVYASPGFLGQLAPHDWGTLADLWVADWTGHVTDSSEPPWLPHGWNEWTFWQWTATGHVDGYPGGADLNVYRDSPAALRRSAGQADTEPVPPPSERETLP